MLGLRSALAGLVAFFWIGMAPGAQAATLSGVVDTPGGETFSEVGSISIMGNPISGVALFVDVSLADLVTTMVLTSDAAGTFDGGSFAAVMPPATGILSGSFMDGALSDQGGVARIDVLFGVAGGSDAPKFEAGLIALAFVLPGFASADVTAALTGTGNPILTDVQLNFREVQAIPLPATGLLLLGALGGLVLVRRKV